MGQLEIVNTMDRRMSLSIILLVISILPLITCEQSQTFSSHMLSKSSLNQSPNHKLKICSGGATNKLGSNKNSVRIPTFSAIERTYNLEEYEVERNPMESCKNGEKLQSPPVAIIAKVDYDEEFEASNFSTELLFQFLRSAPFLFDNGYLSVGDHERSVAEYYSTDEFCIDSIQGEDSSTVADFKICPFSKSRPRLSKCCPLGMVLGKNSCIGRKNGEKWDPGYMDAKTWKMLKIDQVDPVYTSPELPCDSDGWEYWQEDNCTHEFHPVTDNTVAFIGAYRSWEFLSSSTDWCIDSMEYNENGEDRHRMVLFHCVGNTTNSTHEDGKSQARISLLYMVNMYIGAFFHFLTTLVYLVTWTKQNIHGKTLSSCTASLFFMQIFLGTAHLLGRIRNQRNTAVCIVNSIGGQYFMIAAFTWLVIVNFDLWRTFRSIRTEGGRGLKRFLIYSATGWLFPLLISAISISLDFSFRCRVSGVPVPEFGEYYCFVAPWAQGLYVYYLLGILIVTSYVFAGLTLFGLYTFKKDTVNLRSSKSADDQQNIMLFLKLSVVMGLTWIFEVISWAATKENENHVGWIVLDLYNALSAILIFLIFVCKKTTLNLLEQSIPILKGLTAAVSKLTTTFSGDGNSGDSTASTAAGGHFHHKKSMDSQNHDPVVRYKKDKEESVSTGTGNGTTNKAFEQNL